MTAKKKTTSMPDWAEAAGASRVGVDPEAVGTANDAPAPTSRPTKSKPKPAAGEGEKIVRIEREMKSQWRQLTPRIHPDQWNAFQLLAKRRREQYGEQPRDVLVRALNMLFLSEEPVDEYTQALHDREAQSKRKR